jgi:hypothetical protein
MNGFRRVHPNHRLARLHAAQSGGRRGDCELIGGDWFQSESGLSRLSRGAADDGRQIGRRQTGDGCPSQSQGSACGSVGRDRLPVGRDQVEDGVGLDLYAQKGHVTRIDVALDDREASVAVETVRLAVEAGQLVSRSKQFKVIQASNHREGTRTGETLYFGCPNRRRRRRPPPRFHAGVARPPDGGISGSPMVNEKQVAAPRHVK